MLLRLVRSFNHPACACDSHLTMPRSKSGWYLLQAVQTCVRASEQYVFRSQDCYISNLNAPALRLVFLPNVEGFQVQALGKSSWFGTSEVLRTMTDCVSDQLNDEEHLRLDGWLRHLDGCRWWLKSTMEVLRRTAVDEKVLRESVHECGLGET